MKTFNVTLSRIYQVTITAPNKQDAKELAESS